MNNHEKPEDHGEGHGKPDGGEPDHGQSMVTIIIDNVERSIHRGHQTVVAIKTAGEVPLAHELEQVVNGVLTPLDDGGGVTLKGGERFVSHPRTGTSS